jgi:UDP-N-acetylmuramyl pentapeptide phosphotransferase/UDP-N-acetylglucosamine-1-phosphate transferase
MKDVFISTSNQVAFGITLLLCTLTFLTQRFHGKYTFDSLMGVQRSHLVDTPRVGGLPILIGILCAAPLTNNETWQVLYPTLIACLPAFLFGLAEDLTKRVGALTRLIATIASGLSACLLSGVSITSIDVPGVDQLLSVTALSILFTAFAVGGVANSVNLIDGYNGMASGFVIFALVAISFVAESAGDTPLKQSAILCAACFAGFYLVNWPWGKLFLGDGGSYLAGFIVAWFCVLLTNRNETVSPFASLLICVYPISETLMSIGRRLMSGLSIGKADSNHLHNLVNVNLLPIVRGNQKVANSVTGFLMALLTAPCLFFLDFIYDSSIACLALILAFLIFYIFVYWTISSKKKKTLHSKNTTTTVS